MIAPASVYDSRFFSGQAVGSVNSARVVVPLILENHRVQSIVDVGCGVGGWLSEFKRQGVERVLGIDGDYVETEQLQIDATEFRSHDLEEPLPSLGRFDLAIALEVAEHLSESRARSFVADLCRLSDIIVFSAAIPNQGGNNHINEQWQSYWADLFLEQGYVADTGLRQAIWDNRNVEFWYRQNILTFIKSSEAQRVSVDTLNLVHFELAKRWSDKLTRQKRRRRLLTGFARKITFNIGSR